MYISYTQIRLNHTTEKVCRITISLPFLYVLIRDSNTNVSAICAWIYVDSIEFPENHEEAPSHLRMRTA